MVKAGYKQTEIGEIPEDWDAEPLDKLTISISSGTSTTRSKGGDYPIFGSTGQIGSHSSFDYEGPKILVARVGANAGTVNEVDGRYCVSDNTLIVNFKKNFEIKFFYYQLIIRQLNTLVFGSGQPLITGRQLKALKVPVPSNSNEQKAIAGALSDVDGLIGSLEKLIEKKCGMKTATMQQLLTGKKRLPGFKDEWSSLSIGEHAYLKARIGWQALTTNEYREFGNYRLVTGTDFKNGRIDWSTCWYVDQWRYSQDRNIQLSEEDVLITKDGTIGKVGYVDELTVPATLNSGVFVIRPIQNSFHPKFLYYVLSSTFFDKFLDEITAGSTITHLYQKDFVNFEFKAPEHKEQVEIARILSSMDLEINELHQQLSKTKAIKQGLMQELLTGRTRLV